MAATSVTTVRISSRASRKLDALQARHQLHPRRRVTKQTILEELIDRAYEEQPAPLLIRPPKYPLSTRQLRALADFPVDWGIETREEDIDRILYGDGA